MQSRKTKGICMQISSPGNLHALNSAQAGIFGVLICIALVSYQKVHWVPSHFKMVLVRSWEQTKMSEQWAVHHKSEKGDTPAGHISVLFTYASHKQGPRTSVTTPCYNEALRPFGSFSGVISGPPCHSASNWMPLEVIAHTNVIASASSL